ncbi:hypothetical protein C8R46DRAFT_1031590 [Mycena filopes]|nr:hypothetical protein C8R46DRAFT_1031590 [Mycena filopes]
MNGMLCGLFDADWAPESAKTTSRSLDSLREGHGWEVECLRVALITVSRLRILRDPLGWVGELQKRRRGCGALTKVAVHAVWDAEGSAVILLGVEGDHSGRLPNLQRGNGVILPLAGGVKGPESHRSVTDQYCASAT